MDLRYTADEQQFRAELREWLADVLPGLGPEPHREDWDARRAWDTGWQRMLFDAGYAGINWPREFGGRGATPTEHLIFIEETERARAPYVGMNFVGLLHAGPTLVAEASDEQKAFHLPGILKGEHVWCQGFSEPNAGSDLASLRTPCRARRRRLRDHRPEDLDQLRPRRRLLRDARAHRRRGAEAPRHLVADRADGHAGDRRAAAPHHGGHRRVLRGVLRRRARPGRQPCRRRERRLARRHGHAELRARHRVRLRRARVDGARARPRRAGQDDHQQRRHPLGGRRTPSGTRTHRRRVRRAVGAHQAQHLAGATHRPGGRRWQRVQDRVVRPPPAPRRRHHAPARPRLPVARRRARAPDRSSRARPVLRPVDDASPRARRR